MRSAIIALLVAVPLALVVWVGWRGRHAPPPDPAALGAAGPASAPARDEDAALRAILAPPPAGLTMKGALTLYDAQKLFDYIDGAAPVYLERHFRRLAAAELATADGGELTADVYDMTAPANAESIFTKERSPAATAPADWPEALTGPKSFIFREGRYYVKLTAFDAKAEALLPRLARELRGRMK
ncbi:MAG TPA: DUF6599 family protein [Polyangia bacterium]